MFQNKSVLGSDRAMVDGTGRITRGCETAGGQAPYDGQRRSRPPVSLMSCAREINKSLGAPSQHPSPEGVAAKRGGQVGTDRALNEICPTRLAPLAPPPSGEGWS